MNNDRTPSIQEKVEERIRAGVLRPRSRLTLLLQAASVGISALAALVALIVMTSFLFFSVHESGELFLLGFGMDGILIFFALFPWVTALIAFLLVTLFQWRLSHLVPTYRIPILPFFGALVLAVTLIGYALAPLHTAVWDRIEDDEVPVIGDWYESVYASREGYGLYRGRVTAIEPPGFWLIRSDGDADEDDRPRLVHPREEYALPEIDDELLIYGVEDDGIIEAVRIATFPTEDVK